jgi:copper(I)-binding protein
MRLNRSYLPCLLLVAAFMSTLASVSRAQEFQIGSITVERPWTRATPGGAKVAGGYLTVVNKGTAADRLLGATFARAGRAEIHEMKMEGGVMQMRPVPNGVEVKAGQTVKLEPNGYHMMFMDLKEPLKQGEKVKGQLRFEKAGTLDVEYSVEALGAQGPGQGMTKGMPGMQH